MAGCMDESALTEKSVLDSYKKALKAFNAKFELHMSIIIDEILKRVKPTSIYLIGSFGRNEGALYLSGTRINPIRDYDILIIVDKYIKNNVIKDITKNINNRLALQDQHLKAFITKNFNVWITQAELKDINSLPLLKFYELKKASKILWGKDIRDYIRISIQDISKYNGILILSGKVRGLLQQLNIYQLKRKTMPQKMINFIYECMKTNVEISTCLSLLTKMYKPNFLLRCKEISNNFHTLFPELEEKYRIKTQMIKYAYRRLLINDDYLNDLDIWKLFSESLQNLKIITLYYMRKAYEIDINSFTDMPYVFDDSIKKLNGKVLEDLIGYYIKKFGIDSKIIREIAIRLYLKYTLLMFFLKARKLGYRVKPKIIFMRDGNIMLKLWFLGFLLLDCIKSEFEIDAKKLNIVERKLSEIIYVDEVYRSKDPNVKFSYLQKITVNLLDLADKVFHQKD
ncbi:MAG: hypothetical protein QW791_04965 [Candidatus Bathyarchaeia archaeon]